MSCPACARVNQVEFASEMMIHLPGLKSVANPGVLIFPKLLVCLDCGFARFTINGTELGLLTAGTQGGLQRSKQVAPCH